MTYEGSRHQDHQVTYVMSSAYILLCLIGEDFCFVCIVSLKAVNADGGW